MTTVIKGSRTVSRPPKGESADWIKVLPALYLRKAEWSPIHPTEIKVGDLLADSVTPTGYMKALTVLSVDHQERNTDFTYRWSDRYEPCLVHQGHAGVVHRFVG